MSARRETSMIVLASAFCIAAVAVQAQNIAADKQVPKAARKDVPPNSAAWKWKPADKDASRGASKINPPDQNIRQGAYKIAPGEKNAIKGDRVPARASATKVDPGTKQSLNPQPLPPREAAGAAGR